MKPNKRLAAGVAAAMAVGGIAVITTVASPAQASSQNFVLYSQINNSALAGPAQIGSKNVQMTQSPASPNVGAAIAVVVTSSDLSFNNGPAAPSPAGAAELDAVISLNGVDYTLRGSQTTITVNTGATNRIFDTGWTVSSTAGASTATSTNITAPAGGPTAGTTGIGATVRGAEATAVSLVAPNAAGTYTIGLKALVNNSLGTSPGLTDPFDNIYGTDATGWVAGCGPSGAGCAGNIGMGDTTGAFATNATNGLTATNGNIVFTTPVSFTAVGPSATIATSSGQNAGVQAARFSAAYATTVALTGTVFPASQSAGAFTVALCDTAGTTCDTVTGPPGTLSNTLSTNGSGVLTGNVVVLSGNGGITKGSQRSIKITGGGLGLPALVPFLSLASPTVTLTPAGGPPGSTPQVSGTNFNPSQAVNIQGSTLTAIPFTASTDTAVAATAGANGVFPGTALLINDPGTKSVTAGQGIPGIPSASNPSGFALWSFAVDNCVAYTGNKGDTTIAGPPTFGTPGNEDGCNTQQIVKLTVLAGTLNQRAYAVAGNVDSTTINLGTFTSPLAPVVRSGNMNDIIINDNRGGTFGWSLTASLSNFGSDTGGVIARGNLAITPTCTAATVANNKDNNTAAAIAGFDPTTNAPGILSTGNASSIVSGVETAVGTTSRFGTQDVPGAAALTVSLCQKTTTPNAVTQTTGGVYKIVAPVALNVASFQLAGAYAATMTITLA